MARARLDRNLINAARYRGWRLLVIIVRDAVPRPLSEYVSRCAARARVPHHRKLSSRIIFQINFRNISYIARLCQEQYDPILKKKMILANHLCREKWKGRMYNEKLFDIVVIILLDTFLK